MRTICPPHHNPASSRGFKMGQTEMYRSIQTSILNGLLSEELSENFKYIGLIVMYCISGECVPDSTNKSLHFCEILAWYGMVIYFYESSCLEDDFNKAHSYPAGGNWSRTAQLRCAVLSLNPRACALEQTSFNIYGNYKISYTKSIQIIFNLSHSVHGMFYCNRDCFIVSPMTTKAHESFHEKETFYRAS